MEGVGVEKSESANGLNVGRKRHALHFDQVQLIFSDLLGAEQLRRFAKVFGKLGNAADVGGDGGGVRSCESGDLPAFVFVMGS
jgi:hypothetical protein